MTVLLVIVGIVVVAVGCYAAGGRGGELSAEQPDYAPLEMGPVSATDVVLHRPPSALWGYSMDATDEALERIAQSIRERDVRIVALEQLVTDLGQDPAPAEVRSSYVGARRLTDDLDTTPAVTAGPGTGAAGKGPSLSPPDTSEAGMLAGAEADTAPQPPVRLEDDTPPHPIAVPPAITAPQLTLDPEVQADVAGQATFPVRPVVKPMAPLPEPPLPPGAVIKSSLPPVAWEAESEGSGDPDRDGQDGGQQAQQQKPPPERSHG